ncbi:PREDICTED: probable LRR receptor-like serine/threonine-protein kinase At2g16250 [Tarenaya hassleriana]|uniref:probable LRR receptor-like serine/threonine-protein kinase At2g16250 n=1 Tax=Tarenaya hassleriana TaxID=28532 RepID=UPI0008FD5BE1|nr:PREDICTED: probable LRR receptor-like serine/threonine-protein kinase At2g16250 [Tarenaya hassleriana]
MVLLVSFFFLSLESTSLQRIASPTEKSALLALRSSLGLRSRDWPLKGDPCLNWNGIRCENGSVVGIAISGFRRTRLGGRNPRFSIDSLSNLTSLISFNASKFLLPGPIPDWCGLRLLTLRVMDLSSCSIIGSIPNSHGNLTSLIIVDLSDNNITGTIPASLTRLSRLFVLDLSKNSLIGSIPLSFTTFANLSSLDLSSNSLSGLIPASIGILSKLHHLNLSSNGFSHSIPPSLGDLSTLMELDLSFNRSEGFKELTYPCNHFSDVLPNITASPNSTVLELDISRNMFYRKLTILLRRFRNVELSRNYFKVFLLDSNTLVSEPAIQSWRPRINVLTNWRKQLRGCNPRWERLNRQWWKSGHMFKWADVAVIEEVEILGEMLKKVVVDMEALNEKILKLSINEELLVFRKEVLGEMQKTRGEIEAFKANMQKDVLSVVFEV